MLSALVKYVINRLIHGLFHSSLVISPRLISSLGLKPSGPISRFLSFVSKLVKMKIWAEPWFSGRVNMSNMEYTAVCMTSYKPKMTIAIVCNKLKMYYWFSCMQLKYMKSGSNRLCTHPYYWFDMKAFWKSLKIPRGIIRIRKSQDRQQNGQKKKDNRKNNDLQNINIKHELY